MRLDLVATSGAERPISVHLTEEVATIDCGACRTSAAFATDDRLLLAEQVRAFLDQHDGCLHPTP